MTLFRLNNNLAQVAQFYAAAMAQIYSAGIIKFLTIIGVILFLVGALSLFWSIYYSVFYIKPENLMKASVVELWKHLSMAICISGLVTLLVDMLMSIINHDEVSELLSLFKDMIAKNVMEAIYGLKTDPAVVEEMDKAILSSPITYKDFDVQIEFTPQENTVDPAKPILKAYIISTFKIYNIASQEYEVKDTIVLDQSPVIASFPAGKLEHFSILSLNGRDILFSTPPQELRSGINRIEYSVSVPPKDALLVRAFRSVYLEDEDDEYLCVVKRPCINAHMRATFPIKQRFFCKFVHRS